VPGRNEVAFNCKTLRDSSKEAIKPNTTSNTDDFQLQNMMSEINLTEGRDGVVWALEKSRKYSTNSLYKLMTFGGVRDVQMMRI
jgi:phage tail tube protein FII